MVDVLPLALESTHLGRRDAAATARVKAMPLHHAAVDPPSDRLGVDAEEVGRLARRKELFVHGDTVSTQHTKSNESPPTKPTIHQRSSVTPLTVGTCAFSVAIVNAADRRKWREFGQWIRLARKKSGLTQAALAELVKVDTSTISQLENGRREPNPTTRWTILEQLTGALLAARETMPPPPVSPEEVYPPEPHLPSRIAVIGTVPGGPTALRYQWSEATSAEGFESVDRGDLPAEASYFALRVDGESMAPTVWDGDLVICTPVPRYEDINPAKLDGRLVVVNFTEESMYGGETTIARWKMLGDQIVLSKDNPRFSPLVYPPDGVHGVAVVVELRRRTAL